MPAGRPEKIDAITLKKLEEAFTIGCTDIEACLNADISHQTLYNYQKKHPKFVERKAALKESPVLKARKRVESELENDTNTAKWYLERKRKDEFGPNQKTEVEITNIEDVVNAISGE